jgi:Lon protease-like protein
VKSNRGGIDETVLLESKVNGEPLTLLPIFPLGLVLFPGAPLPLHIFEPRYKEMIGECLEQKKLFGILRASEEGVAEIGCTAEIVTVTKRYDDGRMDIIARGVDRFEVVEVNQDRSFLQAEVVVLNDNLGTPAEELVAQAVKLHEEIIRLVGVEGAAANFAALRAESTENLSFQLAGSLPFDLDFKQSLLATLSEEKRLEAFVGYLQAILPGVRRASQARWN